MRMLGAPGLIVVLLAAPARADEAEAAALEKLGATLQRDQKLVGTPVVAAYLDNTKASDADLRHLAAFPGLGVLALFKTAVGDAGLKQLAGLKDLHWLRLDYTRVTD